MRNINSDSNSNLESNIILMLFDARDGHEEDLKNAAAKSSNELFEMALKGKFAPDLEKYRPKVIEALLNAGKEADVKFKDGQTPLQIARKVRDKDTMKILLEAGATPDKNTEEFIKKSNDLILIDALSQNIPGKKSNEAQQSRKQEVKNLMENILTDSVLREDFIKLYSEDKGSFIIEREPRDNEIKEVANKAAEVVLSQGGLKAAAEELFSKKQQAVFRERVLDAYKQLDKEMKVWLTKDTRGAGSQMEYGTDPESRTSFGNARRALEVGGEPRLREGSGAKLLYEACEMAVIAQERAGIAPQKPTRQQKEQGSSISHKWRESIIGQKQAKAQQEQIGGHRAVIKQEEKEVPQKEEKAEHDLHKHDWVKGVISSRGKEKDPIQRG